MSITRKPSNVERAILLTPVKKYIEKKYKIKVLKNDTLNLKPPYVILANHVTDWDPLFINCYVPQSISFVAASQIFKNPIMAKILNYTGAISKTKGRADSSTIRSILKAKKANRVIGIFPEGNRTWNGETEQLVYSTAKLIRSLNIPVVIAKIEGGYLSQPRWSTSVRKGEVHISFEEVWKDQDLKSMSQDVIYSDLEKYLYQNDFNWQQQLNINFEGKNMAHYLERYLHTCPRCNEVNTMQSSDNLFFCKGCSYEVEYTAAGKFIAKQQKLLHETPISWNAGQTKALKERLENNYSSLEQLRNYVRIRIGTEKTDKRLSDIYEIRYTKDAIILEHDHQENIVFPFSAISYLNIFQASNVEIYLGETSYDLKFTEERASAYLWLQIMQLCSNAKLD